MQSNGSLFLVMLNMWSILPFSLWWSSSKTKAGATRGFPRYLLGNEPGVVFRLCKSADSEDSGLVVTRESPLGDQGLQNMKHNNIEDDKSVEDATR